MACSDNMPVVVLTSERREISLGTIKLPRSPSTITHASPSSSTSIQFLSAFVSSCFEHDSPVSLLSFMTTIRSISKQQDREAWTSLPLLIR
jgi:hypothetical protein